MRSTRDPLRYFELMNFYTGQNPPPADESALGELFKTAGVGPGSQLPDEPHCARPSARARPMRRRSSTRGFRRAVLRNGWRVPDPASGLAGPYLLRRAVLEATQMGIVPARGSHLFLYVPRWGEPPPGPAATATR